MSLCLLPRAAHSRFLDVFYPDKVRKESEDRRMWLWVKIQFTQRQVAEGTEMNVRTVINIEKGKTIPNLLYAMKLAKFLGLRVEEVFEYYE